MAKRTPEEEALARIESAQRDGATSLDLSELGLTVMPDAIGNLAALQSLDLGDNQLTTLPDAIGNLAALTKLYLLNNQLTALPDATENLAALNFLGLGKNQLATVPEVICNLAALESLQLWANRLTKLPGRIGDLANLKELNLAHNRLIKLPEVIGNLTSLESLYLHGNDALGIPPEILGPTSGERDDKNPAAAPDDILSYYFRSRTEAKRVLNEAKIILVGQGGVGKSSVVKRLVAGDFDEKEAKTEGIDIVPWSLPVAGIAESVRLNIWDFGGQEIMHATHRFFLSQRSLYLLVIDARQGASESNIQYWLEIIQSYGSDSPVLVVVNKSDEQGLDLDESRLKIDFAANLRQFIRTSAKSGQGMDVLRAAIAEQLSQLTHIRDTLPASYFAVKGDLESLSQEEDFVPRTRYLEICQAHGVTEELDQRVLLRFLHDLGNVLNFDDPDDLYRVQETNILNPEWVTGGVYRILNDRDLLQTGGVLDRSDVDRILGGDDRYPAEQRDFIIDMMRKFELCFAFSDAKDSRLLVPELLNPNEPYQDTSADSVLRFQYAYTVLPGGVLPRFIVRMSHALTDPPVYWRSGVRLELEGCHATVRADVHANLVHITIDGPENSRRQALSTVRDSFTAIHATIPSLSFRERVPIPDDPSVLVNYDHLLRLEENGEPEFWPEGAHERYNVQSLLNGIEDPKRRAEDRERRRERGERFDYQRRSKSAPLKSDEPPVATPRAFGGYIVYGVAAFVVIIAAIAAVAKFSESTTAVAAIIAAAITVLALTILTAVLMTGKIGETTFNSLFGQALKRDGQRGGDDD